MALSPFFPQLRALLRDLLPGDIGSELGPARLRRRLQVLPRCWGQVRQEPTACMHTSPLSLMLLLVALFLLQLSRVAVLDRIHSRI